LVRSLNRLGVAAEAAGEVGGGEFDEGGATSGGLLTKAPDKGGLGFGTIGSSAVLAVILVGLIGFTSRRPGKGRRGGRQSRGIINL